MLCGEICTIAPKLHGNFIILGTILLYGCFTNFATLSPKILLFLIIATILIETGSYVLRIYVAKGYSVPLAFITNMLPCNLGGIIAANSLLGPFWGIWIWQIVAGKTLLPQMEVINKFILKLSVISLCRSISGFIIVLYAILYII
jgi:hypothetical protein